ncbi:hypothetical protein J6590_018267 [Homalodisca vitripennis]|nr:hypothetical protein J6590_018267 [Homalodisca vitripennis]
MSDCEDKVQDVPMRRVTAERHLLHCFVADSVGALSCRYFTTLQEESMDNKFYMEACVKEVCYRCKGRGETITRTRKLDFAVIKSAS